MKWSLFLPLDLLKRINMNKGAPAITEWDARSVAAIVVRVSNFAVDIDIHDNNLDGTKKHLKPLHQSAKGFYYTPLHSKVSCKTKNPFKSAVELDGILTRARRCSSAASALAFLLKDERVDESYTNNLCSILVPITRHGGKRTSSRASCSVFFRDSGSI